MLGLARGQFFKITTGGGGGGSFPQIAAQDHTVHAVSTTSHSGAFSLGTITAGDLLLCLYAGSGTDGTPNTAATGWTVKKDMVFTSSTGHCALLAKVATGSETSPLAITTDVAEQGTFLFMRIANGTWGGNLTNDVVVSTGVTTSSSNNPNPDSLAPGWTDDTLWIACAAADVNAVDFTGYPSNYINGQTDTPHAADGAAAAWATRELNAASEDPGAFAMDTTIKNVAFTVAVKPA